MSKREFISHMYVLRFYFLQVRKTKIDLMECRGPKHDIFRGNYILVRNLMQLGSCTNITEETFANRTAFHVRRKHYNSAGF
jgi:hypothetical protein